MAMLCDGATCSVPDADPCHPRMAWDPRLGWPWRAIRGSMDGMAAFGARCGSRPDADDPPHAKFPAIPSIVKATS